MNGADALSRLPTILFLEEIQRIYRAEVIDAQREDNELSLIIKILSIPDQIDKTTRDKLKTSVEKSFLSEDGLLLRNVGPRISHGNTRACIGEFGFQKRCMILSLNSFMIAP